MNRQKRISIKIGDLLVCEFQQSGWQTFMLTAWSIDSRPINIPCLYVTIDEDVVEIDNKTHIFEVNSMYFKRNQKINYGSIRILDRRYEYDYWGEPERQIIETNEKIKNRRLRSYISSLSSYDLYEGIDEDYFCVYRGQNIE